MHTLAPDRIEWKRPAIIVGTIVLATIVYLLMPADMNELAKRAVAIFIIAAVFWATEVIPLYATSLCLVGLQVLLLAHHGGLAPADVGPDGGNLQFTVFFTPFASPVIILFLGGFLLSSAVTKHALDRAIAAKVLDPFTRNPLLLIYGVMLITAFFSMWMSNTATTAMMLAIVAPLLKNLSDDGKFHLAVILAVPMGANIGGIGTPIGTPPNAVALAALRQGGFDVGFLDWMLVFVPLAVLLMAVAGVLLYFMLPPGKALSIPRLKHTEPISTRGKITLAILVLTICLWLTGSWHGIDDAVIALIAAALLTGLQMLDRRDVDTIDWNILILMWGGLALGNAMSQTGLVAYLMDLPIAQTTGFLLALTVVLLAYGLSTFMSNTAAANLIIPMALAFPAPENVQLIILTALACSFAMALPISTPPNAMAFATGRLPAATLLRVGGLISAIAIGVLLMGYQVMLPLILNL
ncbi:DASS family sodium-coupled anion symporter [Phycisphaerales bacterium AB-hyl4]|uniref:DASS family sodium-coupled anion symporter n=1 Tax=Natronomicrosphaera hydrolytica TaxID=3242702 RepID=A0ABV4U5M9_9BACT